MEQCVGGAFGEAADTEGLYVYISAESSLKAQEGMVRWYPNRGQVGGKGRQVGPRRSGMIDVRNIKWTERIFSADCTSWDKK